MQSGWRCTNRRFHKVINGSCAAKLDFVSILMKWHPGQWFTFLQELNRRMVTWRKASTPDPVRVIGLMENQSIPTLRAARQQVREVATIAGLIGAHPGGDSTIYLGRFDVVRDDIRAVAYKNSIDRLFTQLGMSENSGRPRGFTQGKRRLTNISSLGEIRFGWSRLPSWTKTRPGKDSRLLV